MWLRPIHNLLQNHQHQHCRLSNGGQHTISMVSTEHMDKLGTGEELEMKVRGGSTNGNGGDNPAIITQGVGSLLGRLNGGMNYPTILPSFVCSYSSKTPPSHSKQSERSPEQRPPTSEHTETLTKLYQLMGQHSKNNNTHNTSPQTWCHNPACFHPLIYSMFYKSMALTHSLNSKYLKH